MEITLILPVKNDYTIFKKTLNAVLDQTKKPKEIIIVDSSISSNIQDYLNEIKSNLKIKYISVKNKFPGEARNIGIKNSSYDLIAFLDSKTIPARNWLEKYYNKIINDNFDVVFGTTIYKYKNNFQKKIRAATFGNIFHFTTPGSLIKKKILFNDNFFIEGVRTADDFEWRETLIKKKYNIFYPINFYLQYESLPPNLITLLKRYFVYSFHTARVNVDKNIKFLYIFFFSLFCLLLIPKWNQYIPNWNQSHPLYINNNYKIFLLLVISCFIIIIFLQNFNIVKIKFINSFLKICLIITSLIFIYNWNYLIAGWIEKSIFYFPHITKIYVVLLLLTSFLLRGIYYPLKRNIKKSYIFPFNWISIGFYGFTLDLVKAPGYLLGSIIPFALKKFKIKNNLNIVFYSKYGIKSPSYRTRFLAYKNYLEDNNFKVETKTLFSESFYNDRIFKNKNNIFKLSYFYLLRIYDLLFRKKPFLAIVHIEILPFIPFLGEKILNLRKIPFIIDIDDAVYFRFAKYNNFFNKLYKKKFLYSVNCSKGLFAGNNFHQTFFSKFKDKVFYLPTVINCNEYDKFLNTKKHSNFTVVWIGTPSTTNYLVKIINVLNDLVYYHNVSIKIIGADKSKIKNLKCETLEWNQKTELIELSKCHVGIMPLDNTPWELGKCGYKILQYMSLKLAVVASAVGVNKEIIKNGYNGLFANDDTDWQNAILKLKNDSSLINEFGKNGYDTVKNKFNLDYFKKKYKNIIENIHKSSICNYEKEN